MKLLVGLGNPDNKFLTTRHNVGFCVLDMLQHELGFPDFSFDKSSNAEVSKKDDVLLVKPQTYMNDSGDAVAYLFNFYTCTIDDLLVIHDEVELSLGDISLSRNKSASGHNGVRSIIDSLGNTSDFYRLRIGVGRPEVGELKEYVLAPLGEDLEVILKKKEEIKERIHGFLTT